MEANLLKAKENEFSVDYLSKLLYKVNNDIVEAIKSIYLKWFELFINVSLNFLKFSCSASFI